MDGDDLLTAKKASATDPTTLLNAARRQHAITGMYHARDTCVAYYT